MLRPASPKDPSTAFDAKAQVLNTVPATQGLLFGFPMRLGLAQFPTVPPQSEVDRLDEMSVGVYQFPVEPVTIPATCHPPMTWFIALDTFFPNSLPLPNGSS